MPNYFDELLESIGDETDRKALATLGQKHAALREGVMRQSDYSRKQDELKSKVKLAEDWEVWKRDNWNDEHKLTVGEIAREATIADLQTKLAAAGNGEGQMTFAEIEAFTTKMLNDRKVVTADQLEPVSKTLKDDVQKQIDGYAGAVSTMFSKTIPLAMQHSRDYNGEILNIDEMFEKAAKAGINDVTQAYDLYTADKRSAKQAADLEKLKKDSFEEGRKAALTETTMGQNGRMPIDNEGPGMGHLERQMFQGQKSDADKAAQVIPDEVPLEGSARFLAQHYRREKAEQQLAR